MRSPIFSTVALFAAAMPEQVLAIRASEYRAAREILNPTPEPRVIARPCGEFRPRKNQRKARKADRRKKPHGWKGGRS